METIKRKCCRAILLTPNDEVLLIQIENPNGYWKGWITPGGGIDAGENEATALRRELYEELGLEIDSLGAKVWTRFHSFQWKEKIIEQHEDFFFILTERFAPQPTLNPDDSEMLILKEFRWWTITEISNSKEEFVPRNLAQLLKDLKLKGPPAKVIDVVI
ncbi:MAG: NUDIX domain-containing protein [Pseudomonadota bacterium]|nr:NUDIX domain-containing protein [Pseudomonadota bacterium]